MSGGLIWIAIHTTHADDDQHDHGEETPEPLPDLGAGGGCGMPLAWVVAALMRGQCSVFDPRG